MQYKNDKKMTDMRKKIISHFSKKTPNQIIGGAENPYLFRWYVIPKNPFLNIYIHLFLRSDDDRPLRRPCGQRMGLLGSRDSRPTFIFANRLLRLGLLTCTSMILGTWRSPVLHKK